MDRRITLVFAAILVVLGGYIWYTFLRADAPPLNPVTPAPTRVVVLEFPFNEAQALEVREVETNVVTRVVRTADGWQMEQPAQGEAYIPRVERLVFELSRVTAERSFAAADLTPYGLNPPAYQAHVTLQDGSVVTLDVGNENPDGNYAYARKPGDASIYLADFSVLDNLQEFVQEPPFQPTPTPTLDAAATPTP